MLLKTWEELSMQLESLLPQKKFNFPEMSIFVKYFLAKYTIILLKLISIPSHFSVFLMFSLNS